MFNEHTQDIQFRPGTNVVTVMCTLICVIMALRFFFGNNAYIEDVFSKPGSAISRLYHFTVVSIQSLILLGSSFLVKNPEKFILWLGILFFVEVLWYIGCLIFLRGAISNEARRLDRSLAVNELANLIMAVVAVSVRHLPPETAVYISTAIFMGNTAVDLKINLKKYMGTESFTK